MERPVREGRGLGPKALEDGLKKPDPDGSPGTKKVDGLFQDSVGPIRSEMIPFRPGGPDETLDSSDVAQAVFLEEIFDQGPQGGRQSPGLGEKKLWCGLPIGLGIGGKMGGIHDPMAGMAKISPMEGDPFGLDEDLDLAGSEPNPDFLAPMEKGDGVVGALERNG